VIVSVYHQNRDAMWFCLFFAASTTTMLLVATCIDGVDAAKAKPFCEDVRERVPFVQLQTKSISCNYSPFNAMIILDAICLVLWTINSLLIFQYVRRWHSAEQESSVGYKTMSDAHTLSPLHEDFEA